jgi:hypothetical protein
MNTEVKEMWKPIENYGNYEVSSLGKIRNIKTGRMMKSCSKGGYSIVGLCNKKVKTFQIHRLVAIAFLENPENKAHVNHKDKNGLNNTLENLEWATPLENNIHKSTNVIQTTNQNIKIYKVDIHTKEKLEKYDSIESAAKWAFEKGLMKNEHSARTNISNVIRGKNHSSCGYFWELVEQTDLENEEWKEIKVKDFDSDGYFISSLGRFKNKKGIIMQNYLPHHSGYIYLRVNKKKFALHRLVAMNFILNPENKPFVNHIDGNKLNNKVNNLEWVTCAENNLHNHKIGLIKTYTRSIIQYDLDMNEINKFDSIVEGSKFLNLSDSSIKRVLYNKQKTAGGFIFKYLD